MSTIQNLTNGIANADALVSTVQVAAVTTLSMEEQESMLNAEIKAEEEKKAAAQRMIELQAKLAQVKAENAKALADKAAKDAKGNKPKGKPDAKPVVKADKGTLAERQLRAIETAIAQGQVMLSTDKALGVIDPKHHTAGDTFLLEIITKNRTKAEKLSDPTDIPGTFQAAVYSFFNHCGFSTAKTASIMEEALSRNVVSKLFVPTTVGPKVVWFDAQWRPNLKGQEFERISEAQVNKAKALFAKF